MKKTIKEILEHASKVEEVAEKFYAKASERFEGTNIQIILAQLAEEEAGHQEDVDLLAKQLEESGVNFSEEVEIEIAKMSYDNFGKIAAKGEMNQIVFFALNMEKQAVELYSALAAKAVGDAKKAFDALVVFEKKHVDMLSRMVSDLSLNYEDDPGEYHEV